MLFFTYNQQVKTVTVAIGTLAKLDPKLSECQSLILAPTRELAQQIEKVVISSVTTRYRCTRRYLSYPPGRCPCICRPCV